MLYPEILLPRHDYPILKNEDVKDNALVRETMMDVYQFLIKPGYGPDDILSFVVAPQPSLREVFELSTFLYGCYEEKHIGIRVEDAAFLADWDKRIEYPCSAKRSFSSSICKSRIASTCLISSE